MTRADVVVIGAGHNGLVAAARLARAGLAVRVLEAAPVLGGACRTEHPFRAAPGTAASTGAYLLGLMPPEVLTALDVTLPLRRRDPHYLLLRPTRPPLTLGSDAAANHAALSAAFSPADADADRRLGSALAELRDHLAPSWLVPAAPAEDVAERYLPPALRTRWLRWLRGSVTDVLDDIGLRAPALRAMYATTDGMPGSALAPDEPGSGANFLVHNMGRLPGAGGTWMAVAGGMGTVTAALADAARRAGAVLDTGCAAAALDVTAGTCSGVLTADGSSVTAAAVVAAVDPWRLAALGGLADADARLARWGQRPGMTFKLNLALRHAPSFGVPLPGAGTTVHLLPDPAAGGAVDEMAALTAAYADARAGRLPAALPVEVYLTPDLAAGVFVQPVPAAAHWTPALAEQAVTATLDRLEAAAPGLRRLVVDRDPLGPPDIEARFGITGGHIFHVDNSVTHTDRLPSRPGPAGLVAGAAGCHPAGSVIGAAGWVAAGLVLDDLGRVG